NACFGGDWFSPPLTTNTLDDEASVRLPSRKRMVSTASASAESWRSRQLPMSEIDLMSQRSQRLSRAVIALAPLSTRAGGGGTSGFDIMKTVGCGAVLGKAWSRFATPRV